MSRLVRCSALRPAKALEETLVSDRCSLPLSATTTPTPALASTRVRRRMAPALCWQTRPKPSLALSSHRSSSRWDLSSAATPSVPLLRTVHRRSATCAPPRRSTPIPRFSVIAQSCSTEPDPGCRPFGALARILTPASWLCSNLDACAHSRARCCTVQPLRRWPDTTHARSSTRAEPCTSSPVVPA